MSNVLLLDADLIVYRFAAENQKVIDFGDGEEPTIHFDVDLAISNCQRYINQMVEMYKANDYVLCASDKHNFRKTLKPDYKADRKDKPKPLAMRPMRSWILKHKKLKLKPGLEADDLQGIISTNPYLYPGSRKIIVSIDKDMQQIPGWLYNPNKDKKPRLVTEEEADLFFYTQVLTGDPIDGYKGCPGIGPKKAAAILDCEDKWAAIVETYESKGLTADDALLQARMARILRHTDYNYKRKEPILWTPPSTSGCQT